MASPASTTCTLTRKRSTHLTHDSPRTSGSVSQRVRSCSTTSSRSRRSRPSLLASRTRTIPRVESNPPLNRSRSTLIRSFAGHRLSSDYRPELAADQLLKVCRVTVAHYLNLRKCVRNTAQIVAGELHGSGSNVLCQSV